MQDHTTNGTILQTLEECVTEAIKGLKAYRERLSVADTICGIDIKNVDHALAIQDAITGMFSYSHDAIDNRIDDLENIFVAVKEGGKS